MDCMDAIGGGKAACPTSGGLTGVLLAADITGPSSQGVSLGELDELVQLMRASATYVNVHTALKAAGATLEDLVRVRIYVVDWSQDKMPELLKGIENARTKLGATAKPPATLIGVQSLDVPEHLVEIEATAVID